MISHFIEILDLFSSQFKGRRHQTWVGNPLVGHQMDSRTQLDAQKINKIKHRLINYFEKLTYWHINVNDNFVAWSFANCLIWKFHLFTPLLSNIPSTASEEEITFHGLQVLSERLQNGFNPIVIEKTIEINYIK